MIDSPPLHLHGGPARHLSTLHMLSFQLGKHGTTLTIRAAQVQCKEVFEVLKLYASAAVAPPEITLSPSAITLTDPVVLTETVKIKVKVLLGIDWKRKLTCRHVDKRTKNAHAVLATEQWGRVGPETLSR